MYKQSTSKKGRKGVRQPDNTGELVHKPGLDLSSQKFSHISKVLVTGV